MGHLSSMQTFFTKGMFYAEYHSSKTQYLSAKLIACQLLISNFYLRYTVATLYDLVNVLN